VTKKIPKAKESLGVERTIGLRSDHEKMIRITTKIEEDQLKNEIVAVVIISTATKLI